MLTMTIKSRQTLTTKSKCNSLDICRDTILAKIYNNCCSMQVSVSNWSSIVFAAAQAINLICVKEIVAIHHQQDLSFMLIFQCNSISSSAVQAEQELHSSYIRTPWRFFFITGEEGFIPNMFCCCGKDDPVRRNSKCQIGQLYEQCTQNKISVKVGKNLHLLVGQLKLDFLAKVFQGASHGMMRVLLDLISQQLGRNSPFCGWQEIKRGT